MDASFDGLSPELPASGSDSPSEPESESDSSGSISLLALARAPNDSVESPGIDVRPGYTGEAGSIYPA